MTPAWRPTGSDSDDAIAQGSMRNRATEPGTHSKVDRHQPEHEQVRRPSNTRRRRIVAREHTSNHHVHRHGDDGYLAEEEARSSPKVRPRTPLPLTPLPEVDPTGADGMRRGGRRLIRGQLASLTGEWVRHHIRAMSSTQTLILAAERCVRLSRLWRQAPTAPSRYRISPC